jgi:RHS repeat-associated protein
LKHAATQVRSVDEVAEAGCGAERERPEHSARYYNPATGRFLSRDPEDGFPTDPASLHKYLYANGDPVNRIDPSGRADTIETIFTVTVISSPLITYQSILQIHHS